MPQLSQVSLRPALYRLGAMPTRQVVLALALLPLAGCETPGRWVRNGASYQDVERDSYECRKEVVQMYPPIYEQQSHGYTTTRSSSECKSSSSSKNKSTSPDQWKCTSSTTAPYTMTVDHNAGARADAHGACMRVRGYWWQQDR